MNNETKQKAQQLNQWILNQDVVKEYQIYEKLVKNNITLQTMEAELKVLQKEIVKKKHADIDCENLISEYETKKKLFDENPIVYNYLVLKQEVNEFINQIQDDINHHLNKMVD